MDPFDLIRRISRLVDQAEITKNPYDLIEARRLLNNDLVDAVEEYADQSVRSAFDRVLKSPRRRHHAANTLVALEKRPLDREPAGSD